MRKQAHGGNLAWAAALAGCPLDAILDFSVLTRWDCQTALLLRLCLNLAI
jgi:hypothetical protein